jgi:hypothetical protein
MILSAASTDWTIWMESVSAPLWKLELWQASWEPVGRQATV